MRPSDFSIAHRGAGAAVPRAHPRVVPRRRAHGRRHHRVRRHLHQGPPARVPALAVRSPHDDQHPGDPRARGEVHASPSRRPTPRPARPRRRSAAPATSRSPSSRRLCGKMDAANPMATTVAQYMGGTPTFRTDLYATCGTLMTHAESIAADSTPGRQVHAGAQGRRACRCRSTGDYTQEQYAQQMIDEYKAAGIEPDAACSRSRSASTTCCYWIEHEPRLRRAGRLPRRARRYRRRLRGRGRQHAAGLAAPRA